MTHHDLHQRLEAWAAVYGGEQHARLGYSSAERIGADAVHAAVACVSDAVRQAQEIQTIVCRMEAAGRWKEARVLRAEYFLAGKTEGERLLCLRRLGVAIGRDSYYVYLRTARAYVEGAAGLLPVACEGGAK